MVIEVSKKPQVSYLDELLKQAVASPAPVVNPEYGIAPPTAALLQQVRDNAATWVRELAMPTRKDEEWRVTDLSGLQALTFEAAPPEAIPATGIAPFELPEMLDSRFVFVNGCYSAELSNVSGLPEGIFVGSLGQLPQSLQTDLPKYLGNVEGNKEVFTSLNTSGLMDAAVVWIAKDVAVDKPIHLLFMAVPGDQPRLIQPRCLVVAERGSRCTAIEEYVVADDDSCGNFKGNAPYFTNAVTEIWVAENAQVTHAKIQRESTNSFHIGKTAIAQAKDSHYSCTAVSTGGLLSRHHLEVYQQGEGTYTTLNGLAIAAGKQVSDTHSAIVLNHPNGTTKQLHKCIIDDAAQGVFNGKVFVPKPAQLTDASQLNRTLLLSPKARVDTKPQLEITADNVKCSHGATISQLEEDELFYLRSRGLDPVTSRNLLIDGFAGEILQELPSGALQTKISRCVACKSI